MTEGPRRIEGDPRQPIEQRGPFSVLERKILHDRFNMELIADKIRRPDGTEGEQFWVNFPRQAVLIFPMDNERNLYLAEEFTYAINEFKIEAAGGSPNVGESLEDAAVREVREELGVEVESLQKLGTYESITSRVNNKTHAFLARVKSVGESKPDADEVIRLKKFPFPTAIEMVRNGVINTSVVVAALWQIKDLVEGESYE